MAIGLIIIGDEILSGRRSDRHLANLTELLKSRGLQLSWVQILADEMPLLVETFKRTLASGDLVFCTGGIGSTPDDLTRDAVAQALGVSTHVQPDGKKVLLDYANRHGMTLSEEHWRLVSFPQGAKIFLDPVTQLPGFYINDHYFMPGFPEMAQPMMQWVLDNHFAELVDPSYIEQAIIVFDVFESQLAEIMSELVAQFPQTKLFSLPMRVDNRSFVELGVKGPQLQVNNAMSHIKERLSGYSYHWGDQLP